ncbi:peptidyl-tRNA hydrolase [compost metagenome]
MPICAACEKPFEAEGRVHTCPECVKLVQDGEKPKFNDAKQVILIRKDLQMPAGKLGAQVAHASMACILNMGVMDDLYEGCGKIPHEFRIRLEDTPEDNAVHDWMTKSFPKITLEVKNEAQLKRYYDEAVAAGLPASWIVDAGRTVFNGVPTPTCVGIGPASREAIDAITKRLRVYQ